MNSNSALASARPRRVAQIRKSVALVLGLMFVAHSIAAELVYDRAQTVNDQIGGEDTSVRVEIPGTTYATTSAKSGWTGIVEFTNDNSFGGDITVKSGAIKVSHVRALGAKGRIKMYPHTAIIIAVSFKDEAGKLKGNIIDRIDVVNPEGLVEPEMWVSFQVEGEGVKNDIDFSAQEHLWLAAPRSSAGWQNNWETLVGSMKPFGNTYKFGYSFLHYTEAVALQVNNLADVGGVCSVIFRGPSTQVLGAGSTFTGKIRIEDGAWVHVNSRTGLGPVPNEERADQISVSGKDCGLGIRCSSATFPANVGITVEEDAQLWWIPSGASTEEKANVFTGPLCGSGEIDMRDIAPFAFSSAHNTFNGTFDLGNYGYECLIIGNGENFSWGGGTIKFGTTDAKAALQTIVLNSDSVADFPAEISGNGHLIVRGSGTLTMSGEVSAPVLDSVSGGTVWREISELKVSDSINMVGNVTVSDSLTMKVGSVDETEWIGVPRCEYWSAATGWEHKQHVWDIIGADEDGKAIFLLSDSFSPPSDTWYQNGQNGTITTAQTLNGLSDPWTMRFSLKCEDPCAADGSCGDSFALLFHTGGTDVNADGLKYAPDDAAEEKTPGISGAYGFLLYSKDGQFCWIKDKKIHTDYPTVTKNQNLFLFKCWKENTLDVSLSFDGASLTADFTCGDVHWRTVNESAGADFASFSENAPRLSLMTYQNPRGWHNKLLVTNFKYAHETDPRPRFVGGLSLDCGMLTFKDLGVPAIDIAGTLSIAGNSSVASDGLVPLNFTGTTWSFDFASGTTPSFVVPKQAVLPTALTIQVTGDAPVEWVEVVDFTAYQAAGNTLPTVTPSDERFAVKIKDGKLMLKRKSGLILVFR